MTLEVTFYSPRGTIVRQDIRFSEEIPICLMVTSVWPQFKELQKQRNLQQFYLLAGLGGRSLLTLSPWCLSWATSNWVGFSRCQGSSLRTKALTQNFYFILF